MNEEPKSIWKRKWTGPRGLLLGLALLSISSLAILMAIGLMVGDTGGAMMVAGVAIVIFVVAIPLYLFFRWLFARGLLAALFRAACFATLIALFYAVEDWRGWRAWENFRHEWEAKGERFDLASVTPPAVPDEQNFALTPVVATSYEWLLDKRGGKLPQPNTNVVNRLDFDLGDRNLATNAIGSWARATTSDLKPMQAQYRELAAKTNLFAVPSQPGLPAADVLLALSKYDATVGELREAGKLPDSRFPLEYGKDDPAAILLPHLAALKNAAQLLKVRAIAELQAGESQKALEDVRLSLRLAEAIRTEPFLISHLVRIVMLQIALQPVYEGLAEHRWSDAQLAELEAPLARQDFLADYRTAMRGEMVLLQIGCIQWLRRHPDQIANLGGSYDEEGKNNGPDLPGALVAHLIPSGWFYQNQYRCVRMTTEFFLPAVDASKRTVSPDIVRESDRALAAETKHTSPYNILEKMLLPALSSAVKKFAYAQSAVDLARTAIALERYRLAHGKYPATLDVLAPQFIAQVPHDVIGGGPLKYQREVDGQFVLYSVGWNETDDGGVVVFKKGSSPDVNVSEGDWVWRYPQK